MNELTAALRECAIDLLATEERVDVEHLVDCAEQRYPEVFTDSFDRLVRAAARRAAKDVMRELSDDDNDGQMRLPGLSFPTAIAVPAENAGGFYYLRTDKATYAEIEAGEFVRQENVRRAQAKLDQYQDSKEAVRPYIEHQPHLTVADAVRMMRGES